MDTIRASDGHSLNPFPIRPSYRILIGGVHEKATTKEECEPERKDKKINTEQNTVKDLDPKTYNPKGGRRVRPKRILAVVHAKVVAVTEAGLDYPLPLQTSLIDN